MKVIQKLCSLYRQRSLKKQWRARNPHNHTYAVSAFPAESVTVGEGTYGPIRAVYYAGCDCRLTIGRYCSLAEQTTFLLGGEHPLDRVSTYPFGKWFEGDYADCLSKGDIVLEDDVWLGYGVTVLSNARIRRGCVVAAGAVVVGELEPYGIYAGVPARLIRKRFSQEVIDKLMEIDYAAIDRQFYREHKELFSVPATEETVGKLLDALQGGAT